jgi:hypothetical protein
MWDNKKISGSQNESQKESEERLAKPYERGTAVRKSRRRGKRNVSRG